MSRLTLALDIMGGDNGPHIILSAVSTELKQTPHLHLILCGPLTIMSQWLSKQPIDIQHRIILSDCSQNVAMDEAPAHALRHKKILQCDAYWT